MNAAELIHAASLSSADKGYMHYMTWKARADEYLGTKGYAPGDIPEKKAGILEMLEEYAAEEQPVEVETVAPMPAGAVEVLLPKKYCPHWLLSEDGEWVKQGESTETIPAGIAMLRADEAEKAIQRGQAQATANTFRQLRG